MWRLSCLSFISRYGLTVNDTIFGFPLSKALIATVFALVTRLVRTLKAIFALPAGMFMLLTVGLAVAGSLDDNATVIPPTGAAHSSVSTAETYCEPRTGLGFKTNSLR